MNKNFLGQLFFLLTCTLAVSIYFWINYWNQGTLVLNTKDKSNFTAYLNNKAYDCLSSPCSLKLKSGNYYLKISASGYWTFEYPGEINISFNQTTEKDFNLNKKPFIQKISTKNFPDLLPLELKDFKINPEENLALLLYPDKLILKNLEDGSEKELLENYNIKSIGIFLDQGFIFVSKNKDEKIIIGISSFNSKTKTITTFEDIIIKDFDFSASSGLAALSSDEGIYLIDITTERKWKVSNDQPNKIKISENGDWIAYEGEVYLKILNLKENKTIETILKKDSPLVWYKNNLIVATLQPWQANADLNLKIFEGEDNEKYLFLKFNPENETYTYLLEPSLNLSKIKDLKKINDSKIIIDSNNLFEIILDEI